jgi:hypothetical protein
LERVKEEERNKKERDREEIEKKRGADAEAEEIKRSNEFLRRSAERALKQQHNGTLYLNTNTNTNTNKM